ncbi:MAG: ATP-binding protein, partial [Pseudomonadota bacterium]
MGKDKQAYKHKARALYLKNRAKFTDGYSAAREADRIREWLNEIPVSSAGENWRVRRKITDQTINKLESGSSYIHAITLHYRFHAYERKSDRAEARDLDDFAFSMGIEDIVGGQIFDFQPDTYTFPIPSAPFSYPPYLTAKEVEKLLSRRPDHGVWLSPHNRHSIPLEGRDWELARLDEFLAVPDRFKILPVIGPSGSGKTRLVSEWMERLIPMNGIETGWDAGILTSEITGRTRLNARDPKPWQEWEITKNTVIVIDYTHAFDAVAAAILKRAENQSTDDYFKVRVILIDHVMPEILHSDFFWSKLGGSSPARVGQIEGSFVANNLQLHAQAKNSMLLKEIIA